MQQNTISKIFISNPKKLEETLQRLIKLVIDSATHIPMYRKLYGGIPKLQSLSDYERLPITNWYTYTQNKDVIKIVKNPWNMMGILCPWNMENSHYPPVIPYSNLDEEYILDRCKWIVEYIGIKKEERAVFLTSQHNRYSTAYIVNLLISLGFECQVVIVSNKSHHIIYNILSDTNTSTLFLATEIEEFFLKSIPENLEILITFNYRSKINGKFRHFDILHLDEIPLIAVQEKVKPYVWPQDHFYIEESNNKTLLLTTFYQDLSPFIRYDTGLQGTVKCDGLYLF